jgi:hypothetical protein
MMGRQIEIELHKIKMRASLVIYNMSEDINTPAVTILSGALITLE